MSMRLEIGPDHPVSLRRVSIPAPCAAPIRVLYLSDFHLRKGSAPFVTRLIATVESLQPHLILLAGDYVASKAGLLELIRLAKTFTGCAGVVAIAGNHDYYFGIEKIRAALTGAGVAWIEQSSAIVAIQGIRIRIDGSKPQSVPGKADLAILCLHKPMDIEACAARYKLAFAGHLHGGQIVLKSTTRGLYPARFFYKWARREAHINGCIYLISAGLGDTIPLRYNCSREIIVADVLPA